MTSNKMNIFGGGPAGLACAIIMRKMGVEVDIIERQNLEKLFSNKRLECDDVHVVVIDPQNISLLESSLGINFERVTKITAFTKNDSHELDNEKFYLVRKGLSKFSLNYQLYHKAKELGVKFVYHNFDERIKPKDENYVIATGCINGENSKTIYGWRILLDAKIPDRSVIIDFDHLTEEYYYIAKLGDVISCVFLSRDKFNNDVLLNKLKERISGILPEFKIMKLKPFVFRMPKYVLNPYKQHIIGTRRGINDNLLFFGLGDSLLDGINYALWKTQNNFNKNSYLFSKWKKNLLLGAINLLKMTACKYNRKEKFVSLFLDNSVLSDLMIKLVCTPTPSVLINELNTIEGRIPEIEIIYKTQKSVFSQEDNIIAPSNI